MDFLFHTCNGCHTEYLTGDILPIIGVIAERHNAVVKITFPFILLML